MHTCLREKYDKLTDACRKEELKLAILQSQNTELMPNLAAACKVLLLTMHKKKTAATLSSAWTLTC